MQEKKQSEWKTYRQVGPTESQSRGKCLQSESRQILTRVRESWSGGSRDSRQQPYFPARPLLFCLPRFPHGKFEGLSGAAASRISKRPSSRHVALFLINGPDRFSKTRFCGFFLIPEQWDPLMQVDDLNFRPRPTNCSHGTREIYRMSNRKNLDPILYYSLNTLERITTVYFNHNLSRVFIENTCKR